MLYIALIYFPEEGREALQDKIWQEYGAFTQGILAKGHFKAGDALAPSVTATTIQVREGKRRIKDGPFIETKEQLGGFYILECEDLDQAIEVASGIPDAQRGAIEIRPLADSPYCHNEESEWRQKI